MGIRFLIAFILHLIYAEVIFLSVGVLMSNNKFLSAGRTVVVAVLAILALTGCYNGFPPGMWPVFDSPAGGVLIRTRLLPRWTSMLS